MYVLLDAVKLWNNVSENALVRSSDVKKFKTNLTKTLHFFFTVTECCFNCHGNGYMAKEYLSSRRQAGRLRSLRLRAFKDTVVVHKNYFL